METKLDREVNKAFAFERANQWRFNKLYESRNLPYKRIAGKKNKEADALIKFQGRWISVEEKFRAPGKQGNNYDDLLVEVWQDTETDDPGWLKYTKAKWIIYGNDECFWLIITEQLRKYIDDNYNYLPDKVSTKGYGRTLNKVVQWRELKNHGIAYQL